MKTELLFNAIGEIDDRLVVEAEEAANLRQKIGRQKWVALAACLALVVCAGLAAHAAYSSAAVGAFTMDSFMKRIMLSAVFITEKKTFVRFSFSPHHRHLEAISQALTSLSA